MSAVQYDSDMKQQSVTGQPIQQYPGMGQYDSQYNQQYGQQYGQPYPATIPTQQYQYPVTGQPGPVIIAPQVSNTLYMYLNM